MNFTTLCDAVTSFPWTEDFEGLTDRTIPDCWDNTEGDVESNSYRWYYNINTSGNGATNGTSHDGSNCVCFNSFYPHEGKYDYLKTIPLSLPADPAMQLTFWYKNPKGGDYSVYISTDGGITYTTPLVTGLTGVSSWTQMTPIDLSAYAGQEVVLVFKGTSNYASGDAYLYLDDVTVEAKPCEHITSFPWTEDFESMSASVVPHCWDNAASASTTVGTNPEYIWGTYNYNENKMLRLYNAYVVSGSALINTPVIELPSEECLLTFDYSHRANCGNLSVKISTDNGVSFTPLATYTRTNVYNSTSDPDVFRGLKP